MRVKVQFTAQARIHARQWRTWYKAIERAEQVANQVPARSAHILYEEILAPKIRDHARSLRRHFGIQMTFAGKGTVVEAQRCPKSLYDAVTRGPFGPVDVTDGKDGEHVRHSQVHLDKLPSVSEDEGFRELFYYRMFELPAMTMLGAAWHAERNGEDPDRAACQAYFDWIRFLPALVGAMSMEPHYSPATRRSASADFTGWLATQISLRKAKSLNAALSDGTSGSPFDKLLQELPAAAHIEWSDGNGMKRFDTLVRRVGRRMTNEGRRVNAMPIDGSQETYPGEDDTSLARFEAREAVRQELRELRNRARLSELEEAVLELDLQEYDTKDIAKKLARAESTVRVVRMRYRNKLRELAA